MIADYTAKKVEAYQQQAEVVAAMATQERDMTIERANELIKAAEEAREETLTIAQAKYAEQIALAEEMYGHLGELDKEAYEEMVANAQREYDLHVSNADKTYGDTLAIIQQSYIDQNEEAKQHLERIAEITEELNSLETRKSEWLAQKVKERKEQLKTETLSTQEQARLTAAAEAWATDERTRLLEELKDAYNSAQKNNADAWIGMAAHAELYGGRINKETKKLATSFIDNIEHLPKDSKDIMADTMKGMTNEMEKKEPTLFQKASNIANGILNNLRRAFDIRSPSRKMQEIAEQLFAGMDKPMQEAAKKLPAEIDKIANDMLSRAGRLTDPQEYLRDRISASRLSSIKTFRADELSSIVQTPAISSITNANKNINQHFHIDKFIVQDKGDEDRSLQQLQFLAQI